MALQVDLLSFLLFLVDLTLWGWAPASHGRLPRGSQSIMGLAMSYS
jgi:hypothetical protein